jgi:hypothetical protein
MITSDEFHPVQIPDTSSKYVEAGSETLLRQASLTADHYLGYAIGCIDRRLGKGYAAKNPGLIGAFIQTSASDFGAAVVARAIEHIAVDLGSYIEPLHEILRTDHPLQGCTFEDLAASITEGLDEVASALNRLGRFYSEAQHLGE